jgi:hypothetical protein
LKQDGRRGPRDDATKAKISKTLHGKRQGAMSYKPTPGEMPDIERLKKVTFQNKGDMAYQEILDYLESRLR